MIIGGVLGPTTQDIAPSSETITRGTTSGITNLAFDDGLTDTITEGGTPGSAQDNWRASSSSIVLGSLVSGTAPLAGDANDCGDVSDDGRCVYQEANVGGAADTTLDPDNDNVVKGTKTGTFPAALTTDEGTYLQVQEANQGGSQTLAFDAAGEGERTLTTDPFTWSHDPVGTPRGVLVGIGHGTETTDCIVSVTYGGTTMSRVNTAVDTLNEPGRVYLYFLGASIPITDPATVSADIAALGACSTTDMEFVSVSYTAAADTQVLTSATDSENQANPTATLPYSGREAVAAMVFYSGIADVSTAVLACNGSSTCSTVHFFDIAAFGVRMDRQTTRGSTDQVMGYTVATDDVALVYVAITQTDSSLDYEGEYRVDWTDGASACLDGSRILRVSAHITSGGGESWYVDVEDGSDTPAWNVQRITIVATSDPSPTYQTYTLTASEWDLGLPMVRFIDATTSGDATQSTLNIDDLEILCDRPAPEYTVSVKWSWSGVSTTGTEWRLFVEGRRETNPESISICAWSADESTCNPKASCQISTDSDVERDCGVLSADELDTGTPDMDFDDATPTDTSQSTFGVDYVRIGRTYSTTTYDASVQHDWTNTITLADSYQLRVRALRSDTENWFGQVWDWQDFDWTTRVTVSSGVETLYTYALTSACTGAADDCDVSGNDVRMRWVTESSTDTVQSTLTLDQEVVRRTDNDPTLTSPSITPASGNSTTLFDFSVVYTDVVTCPAGYVRINIDATGEQAMSEADGGDVICSDGKTYVKLDQTGFCPGAHSYYFTGSDSVNAEVRLPTPTGTFAWTVTNIAPLINNEGGAPTSVQHGDAYSYDFDVTDNDITIACQSATWSKVSGAVWLGINSGTGVLSGTAPHTTGAYVFWIRVSDGISNDDFNLTLSVTNVPPVITNEAGAPLTVQHGDVYSFDFDATDADLDTLVWSCPVCPGWLSIIPGSGVLSGSAPHTTGDHSVTVRVSDDADPAGTDEYAYVITVTNVAPVITNEVSAPLTVQHGDVYSFDFDATDADLDTLIWSCPVCPGWLSIAPGSGVLSGTAPHTTGDNSVTVRVSDNADPAGTDEYAYIITVTNVAPVITNEIDTDTAASGVPYSNDWDATDADLDPLTWSCVACRAWMNMDENTGTLTGTPDETGEFVITIRVCDNAIAAGCDTDSYTLTITGGGEPPSNPSVGGPWDPPIADFAYSLLDGMTITFTDRSMRERDPWGAEIIEWHWDFGDGSTSEKRNPVHTYKEWRVYEISLTVVDTDGLSDKTTRLIAVNMWAEFCGAIGFMLILMIFVVLLARKKRRESPRE